MTEKNKTKQKAVSVSSVGEKGLLWERSQENGQTGSSWQEGNSNWNNHLIAQWHIKTSLNAQHIKTLKTMSYSSRRPHWLLLLSTQNRKMSLVGTVAAGQYKIGKKPPGQTLTLGWCWWCNGVEHILFSVFGCLTAVQHYLNATIYLSIVAGLVL